MEIFNFWKNNSSNWFNPVGVKRDNFDRVIHSKFFSILQECELSNSDQFSKLDKIIILDQFSRHIYRENKLQIAKNTVKAAQISNEIIRTNINDFTPEEIIWILMPLKHLKDYRTCFQAIELYQNSVPLNFYQDLLRKSNLDLSYNEVITVSPSNERLIVPNRFKDILAFFPTNYLIYRPKLGDVSYRITESFKRVLPKNVIVSLSGGVDSMLALITLKFLSNIYSFSVCAVHINYQNRDTTQLEEEFVTWYCRQIDVTLHIRRIKNVKRGECERDFYEEMTKDVRFQTYKSISNQDGETPYIVLGHNRDDIVENILNNIAKKRDPCTLRGMEEVAQIKDVYIWRPLLEVKKSCIFETAHSQNIPYLINTTPTWSSRGRLRNEFFPAFQKQFGKSIEDSYIHLANTINSYQFIINDYIENINLGKSSEKVVLDIDKFIKFNFGLDLWFQIFCKICTQLRVPILRKKSVEYFVNSLKNIRNHKREFKVMSNCCVVLNHTVLTITKNSE